MSDRPPTDKNTVAGRVRRYARVGGTVGGLAAKLAGNRLFGLELDKGVHAADL
ncbi:MAG TPA: ABC transporter ATP-binding protein, partial [Rhodospirillaceae bacterium]|nr:ABC transporter ATP-binding protein [Rhodospirillaceae bacterium]